MDQQNTLIPPPPGVNNFQLGTNIQSPASFSPYTQLEMPLEEVSSGGHRPLETVPPNLLILPRIVQMPPHQVAPNTTAQLPFIPYYPPQAPLYYYGAYPYSPYTPVGPSYTYVTSPGHLTTGGNLGTYPLGIPGLYPMSGTATTARPPIQQVQPRPATPVIIPDIQPMRPTLRNHLPGGVNAISPRNLNYKFVAVRTANGEETNTPHYQNQNIDQTSLNILAPLPEGVRMIRLMKNTQSEKDNCRKARERAEIRLLKGDGDKLIERNAASPLEVNKGQYIPESEKESHIMHLVLAEIGEEDTIEAGVELAKKNRDESVNLLQAQLEASTWPR